MLVRKIFCLVYFFLPFVNACDTRKNIWELTEYVWNFGIISSCQKGLNKKPIEYFKEEHSLNFNDYKNIKKDETVWIRCRFVAEFYKKVLPEVKYPFVLVISDGDESFPSDCGLTKSQIEAFISHDKIVHIFAQNCDYQGPNMSKITHLPIGLDFHTIAYKGPNGGWGEIGSPQQQELHLKNILKQLKPTHLRKQKAFVDFHLSDTMHGEHKRYMQFKEDRVTIFNRLVSTGLVDYGPWMRRSELWKSKGQYAFSISPHGNGLDCHRTWEDLVLGCIVIVKSSPLNPMYEGLPVVIINDWSEITYENMHRWLNQYQDAFTNISYRKKLTNSYWLKKINEMRT